MYGEEDATEASDGIIMSLAKLLAATASTYIIRTANVFV